MAAKRKSKKKSAAKGDVDPSKRAKACRTKGVRGERQVVAILRELWPDVDRQVQYRGAHRDGADVFSEVAKLDGEVKHRKGSSLAMAIRDAIANVRPGRIWFAVDWPTTGPRKGKPTITFDLYQFVDLIKQERREAEAYGYDVGYDQGHEDAREE